MSKSIEIYKSPDQKVNVEVEFEGDTVWLTQQQMASLFDQTRQNISLHINNCFKDKELRRKSTIKESLTVRKEGRRMVSRKLEYYNLDVIISVGYRVNSKRGTQFRQWATNRLKEYLVKGYAVNQKRLEQLQQAVQLISASGQIENVNLEEAKGLLAIIQSYASSFIALNQFDTNQLEPYTLNRRITYEIQYTEAKSAIEELKRKLIEKKEASKLFGIEKDEGFKGSLQNIIQTFEGEYLYPSIEEQAAHLLYFIVKNHSFVDGNKRIGAFLFIWFLEKNKHRFKNTGELKINDNGLTALTLLVAQSLPGDKDLMIKLIIRLISDH